MPTVQDVYDQLVTLNAQVTGLHNDAVGLATTTTSVGDGVTAVEVSVEAVRTAVRSTDAAVRGVDQTLEDGFTVLTEGIAVLAGLGAQQIRVLNHVSQQQDAVLCFLDQLARITCVLLNESHDQTTLLRAALDRVDSLTTMYETDHPGAALSVLRQQQVKTELERCCPPKVEPPVCDYQGCPLPDPIELVDTAPEVRQFKARDNDTPD